MNIRQHPVASHISRITTQLLRDEAISGKLIVVAVVLAMLIANSFLGDWYSSFWHTLLSVNIGSFQISMDIQHFISDVLMTFFFIVVGLELGRELDSGHLKDRRNALLPIVAACGGMIMPAMIYLAFNPAGEVSRGWAIPAATDIALAVGVLALLGRRIPSQLRIFLLTLAIVDDILAVTVIAIFYSSGVKLAYLLAGLALVGLIVLLRRMCSLSMGVFIGLSVILWVMVYMSGVHSSITGAVVGLLAPLAIYGTARRSIADRLESVLVPFSTFLVVPIFAFANSGFSLANVPVVENLHSHLAAGIVLGLVVGKTLGITLSSWLMVRFGFAALPLGMDWRSIVAVGVLAGIGFTMSLFVVNLAFANQILIDIAKISVFVASVFSAFVGYTLLRRLYGSGDKDTL